MATKNRLIIECYQLKHMVAFVKILHKVELESRQLKRWKFKSNDYYTIEVYVDG